MADHTTFADAHDGDSAANANAFEAATKHLHTQSASTKIPTYRHRLHDGRRVFMAGSQVSNVGREPHFAGAVDIVEQYYELQKADPALHCANSRDGAKIARSLSIPNDQRALSQKRQSYHAVANLSYGMLGRTPDFINAALMALATHSKFLGANASVSFSENIERYYQHCCDRNLFVAHGAINPQIDRTRNLGSSNHPFSGVKIVDKSSDGITVSGAKMILTLAPLADEILIFNMPGLQSGDDDFALAFALPVSTPGLTLICRKPFSKNDFSQFDYPLSNRFDEIDSYLILQDVLVPWDRVFVAGDVAKSNAFYEQSFARHHAGHQGAVRALSKFEFTSSVAAKVATDLGLSSSPAVQESLGQVVANLNVVRALVESSETLATVDEAGVCNPHGPTIQALRLEFPKMYASLLELIRSFAPGSVMALPSGADIRGETGALLDAALGVEDLPATARIALLNLAWDLVGEGFGQRQLTYEIYHAGDPALIARNQFKKHDWSNGQTLVEQCLADIRV